MRNFFLFLFISILSFLSFSTFANAPIKSIGGIKYFAPTPFSPTAMNAYRAGRLRGGVTVDGQFAVAKIKANSVLGLGRQLAKGNPYALAAMAALAYYQDDIGNWLEEPKSEVDGVHSMPPKTISSLECKHYGGTVLGYAPYGQDFDDCKQVFEDHHTQGDYAAIQARPTFCEEVSREWRNNLFDITYKYKQYEGSACTKYGSSGNRYAAGIKVQTKSCPPDADPSLVVPVADPDGTIRKCISPQSAQDIQPKPMPLEDMAPPYADDLMEWHNTSLDELQSWTPYTDGSGNVDSEYVDSFNKPVVSPQMNEYMKSVASGNAQSTNPSGSNYVPQEMMQPTQTAVSATFNDSSFIDPTTDTVVDPTTVTDGAATPTPVQQGTVDNPMHVTGTLTVDVQIPEDDTISQTEYEASNAKFFEQFASETSGTQAATDTLLKTSSDSDASFIDSLGSDVTNASGIPDFPSIASLWGGFSTGTCASYTSQASIAGDRRTITYDQHCPMYHSTVHPLLYWFLNITTGLYIILLAGRTFKTTNS